MSEIIIDSLEGLKSQIPDDGRAVVMFTAPSWCVPCQRFAPHWKRAVENVDDITFFYVDIDKVPDAAVEYGVRGVPTVMLYEDGKYVRNVMAPQGATRFIADIRS